MSEIEDKAARVGHPTAAADPTGFQGVYRVALTGALQSFALPSGLAGRFATLTVVGDQDLQFAFGMGVAPALVLDQLSAPGTGHAAAGKTIFANTSLDRRISRGATHLSFIAKGAGGFLELECSEQAN